MRTPHVLPLLLLLFLPCATALAQRPAGFGAIGFIENRGQVRDERGEPRRDVFFSASANGVTAHAGRGRIHYVYARPSDAMMHRVDMVFVGADAGARVEPIEPTGEIVNYYRGDDAIVGARRYRAIRYHDIYPNIDLVLHAGAGGLKYDLVVRPGGHVADIRILYEGASAPKLDRDGSMRVANPLGTLVDQRPYTYQRNGDRRLTVRSRFTLRGDTVGFAVGTHGSRELVIDPAQEWATFYGGGGLPFFDLDFMMGGRTLAMDTAGNTFMLGATLSSTFPSTPGALRATLQGIIDAFVVKFDPHGNVLFSTFFGGTNGDDYPRGIATDAAGNVFIAGETSSTDIPRAAAFQNTFAGGVRDGFVAKLSPAGALLWGTYCGTAYWDAAHGFAVDDAGNAAVLLTTTGATLSGGAVPYRTPRNPAHTVGGGPGNNDVMVVKYNGATGQPIWASFTGGSATEYGFAAAAGPRGAILITGWTNSTDFPTTPGCAQATNGGGHDAFAVRMDSAGAVQWATYYGGAGNENNTLFPVAIIADFGVSGIAADRAGNAFITGATTGGFPTTPAAWQRNPLGGDDAYCVKFDTAGRVVWATYIGTAGNDYGMGITATDAGTVIVAGTTDGAGLATAGAGQQTAFQATYNGGVNDAFVARLGADGSPTWVTYFGGPTEDAGHGIATDSRGTLVLAGETDGNSAAFMKRSAHQIANGRPLARPGNSGGFDAYITMFCDNETARVDSSGPLRLCAGDTLRLWVGSGYRNVRWYRKNPPTYVTSTEITTARGRDTLAVADSGRYHVTMENAAGCPTGSNDLIVALAGRTAPVIAPASPARLCSGDTLTLSAGPGTFAQYRWERAPGIAVTTPTMKVWRGGTYKLVVTNSFGCRDSATITVNESPMPAPILIAGDTLICAGDTAVLTAQGGTGGTVAWYAVGNATAVGAGMRFATGAAGDFFAVSTTAEGCSTRSGTIRVRAFRAPRPKVQALLPATFCEGDSTILEAVPSASGDAVLPSGAYAAYAWSTGETARRITVKDIPVGTVTISVTVTDTNGCTAEARVGLTKHGRTKPRVTWAPDTVICEGDSVALTADGTFASYMWNDGSTGPRVVARRSGVYVLAARTVDGCEAWSDTVRVTVHAAPAAVISGPVEVCVNTTQSYEVPDRPGARYQWRVIGPSGTIISGATDRQAAVAWAGAGEDTVIVQVTDTNGCSAADTLRVRAGSTLRPNISTNRSPLLCPGDTIELDAGAGFSAYAWNTGDTARTIRIAEPGVYTVSVANTSGCTGTSAPLVVRFATPVRPVIVANRSLLLCPGDTVELDAGAGFRDYLWSNGARVRRIRVWRADSLNVTTTDTNGCNATSATVVVAMVAPPNVTINGPNSLCVNSQGRFSAQGSSGGDVYRWSTRGTGTLLGGQGTGAVDIRWAQAGEDTIDLEVTSAATGCTGRTTFVVTIGTSLTPRITAAPGTAICAAEAATLKAPPGYTAYRWSTGDTTQTITVRSAGPYWVTIRDASGCSGSDTVNVVERPAFTPTTLAAAPGFCPGGEVLLEAQGGFASYEWRPTGETTRSIRARTAGIYTVTVTDAFGCRGTSDTIIVRAFQPPVITAIAESGGDLFAMIDTAGPPAVTFQWSMDSTPIPGATSERITPPTDGMYSVTATSAEGCTATFGPVRRTSAATSRIEIPDIAAAPGERVAVTLLLAASTNLSVAGPLRFEAELRFNKSLLLPASGGSIDGNERVLTVLGTRPSGFTRGELARVELVAALGDTTATPIRLSRFRWLDSSAMAIDVRGADGLFTLLGVCTEGGPRLLSITTATKLIAARPNPARDIVSIDFATAEAGPVSLTVHDALGTAVATVLNTDLLPGRYTATFDTRALPDGAYSVLLTTPTGRAAHPLRVVR